MKSVPSLFVSDKFVVFLSLNSAFVLTLWDSCPTLHPVRDVAKIIIATLFSFDFLMFFYTYISDFYGPKFSNSHDFLGSKKKVKY